jgi:hypothetical protein
MGERLLSALALGNNSIDRAQKDYARVARMNDNKLVKIIGIVFAVAVVAYLVKRCLDLADQIRKLAFAGAQLLIQNNQLTTENHMLNAELKEIQSVERKEIKGFAA